MLVRLFTVPKWYSYCFICKYKFLSSVFWCDAYHNREENRKRSRWNIQIKSHESVTKHKIPFNRKTNRTKHGILNLPICFCYSCSLKLEVFTEDNIYRFQFVTPFRQYDLMVFTFFSLIIWIQYPCLTEFPETKQKSLYLTISIK